MSGKTVRMIALVVVMAAVTCALTLVVQFPVPATGGYIHLGDVAANFGALAFGPWLGFLIAGGDFQIFSVTRLFSNFFWILQAVLSGLFHQARNF